VLLPSSRRHRKSPCPLGSRPSYPLDQVFQGRPGSFLVSAWERVTPTVGIRAGDALLRFMLVPSDGVVPESPAVIETYSSPPSVADMRALLRKYGGRPRQGAAQGREYYMRSALVRAYALRVANGFCGLCRMPPPFPLVNGSPFLEVHHLHRLADGGPDLPENVAALCPTCHRAVHHSVERATLTETLVAVVRTRELAFEQSVTKPS
jgi:5-methylcytosine-specific restriction protein A